MVFRIAIKEIYLWAVFFILVISGALYLRYFYQPSIALTINFLPQNGTFYPFQQIVTKAVIQNTGSSPISNLSFGLYINNTLKRTYRAYLPSGKAVIINYNFTPSKSGNYTLRLIADPSMLYNIQNRNSAQASFSVNVHKPEAPEPYVAFSNNGLLGEDSYTMNNVGYYLALFLFNDTGARQFILTPSTQVNAVIYPALDVFYNYTNQIAIASAYYTNYSLISVWAQGYLTPSGFATAALGKGYNVSTYGNVSIVNLGQNTTMCIWYSNGWVKTLSAVNAKTCKTFLVAQNNKKINVTYSNRFSYKNTTIYNYSGFFQNYTYSGQWSGAANSMLLFQSIANGNGFTNVCYGDISTINNISYCNTAYVEPHNTIMTKTNALIGNYNLSAWTLGTNSLVANLSGYNIKAIQSFNVSGSPAKFVSGFVQPCLLNNKIFCYSSTWNYNSLTLGILDNYNYSVTVLNATCSEGGAANTKALNGVITPGNITYFTIPCYRNGAIISGNDKLGSVMNITLAYKTPSMSGLVTGNADLVK